MELEQARMVCDPGHTWDCRRVSSDRRDLTIAWHIKQARRPVTGAPPTHEDPRQQGPAAADTGTD